MVGKILCSLGMHDWTYPSILAPIVIRVAIQSTCHRCDYQDTVEFRYDPTTGQPYRGNIHLLPLNRISHSAHAR